MKHIKNRSSPVKPGRCKERLDSFLLMLMEMEESSVYNANSMEEYRGVHLYYQRDNFHYPIEVQFNTLYDRQLNNWLHAFLYKKGYPNEIGIDMRKAYEEGKVKNAVEFEEVLNNVLRGSQG